MEVEYKPSFIKDFNKIKSKKDQEKIYKICFEEVLEIEQLYQIKNLKKIKGYEFYYRIRKGDYRIGFKYDGVRIEFMRVQGRGDFIKIFRSQPLECLRGRL